MKISKFSIALVACGIAATFVAGFVIGGIYASTSAARAANASSLVYFTGIHDALARKQYDQATHITNDAVDGHIGVLSSLRRPSLASATYVLPVGYQQETWITSVGLSRVRKSYETELNVLQPETRDFLAASR